LRKKSSTYSPPESFDQENIDGTKQLGARPDPNLFHNLERRSGGQVLQQAKTVRGKFCTYFKGEGSVPCQETFALNV
jgi:hypothetical protein